MQGELGAVLCRVNWELYYARKIGSCIMQGELGAGLCIANLEYIIKSFHVKFANMNGTHECFRQAYRHINQDSTMWEYKVY